MGQGASSLHRAAIAGDLSALRIAVQDNPRALDAREPTQQWTALHIAAAKNFPSLVRELLARGADAHLADAEGRTALTLACAQGHEEVVRDLLRLGGAASDALRFDANNRTPADYARERKHTGVLRALREAGGQAAASAGPPPPPAMMPGGWPSTSGQGQQQQQQQGGGLLGLIFGGQRKQQQQGAATAAPPPPPPPPPPLPPPPPPPYYPNVPAPQAPPPPPGVRGDLDEDWAADERPAAAAARTAGDGDDDDDGGWGAGSSAAAAPAAPAAHAPVSAPFYPPPAAPLPPYGPGAAAAAATPATGGGQTNNNNNNNVVGAVAVGVGTVAGVVGGVAAAGAKALLGAVTNRGQAGQQQQLGGNNTNKPPTAAQPNPPYPPANTTNNNTALAQAAAALDQGAARRFSYDDLSRATNGFAPSNLIGRGGYGCVYRGVMDGVPVAVKTLDAEAMAAVAAGGGGWGGGGNNANDKNGGGARRQGAREFGAEVAILSRLHHPHVVLLLGACPEACMLVYELLDYSLEQLLRGGGGGGGGGTQQQPQGAFPSLPWPERVRIAAETAAALAFLHSANPAIVHLDVKPGNILLTAAPGLRAKLSDVGLSRLMLQQQQNGALAAASTVLDSRLVGSAHYTCPEYVRSGRFGPASDTYSLGIVLLQCLSGRDASSVVGAFEAAMEQARRSGGRDTSALVRCLDPRAGNWPPTEALAFADLAVRCAALSRAERPDLRAEVLPALLQLKQRAALYAQSGASGGGAAASGGGGNNNVNMRRMPSLQAGGAGGSVDAPPSVFVCPITTEVFEEPVLAADGYTYERMAIEGWLVKHNTSPITGLALEHRGLTPNLALKSAIAEWRTRVAGLAAAAR